LGIWRDPRPDALPPRPRGSHRANPTCFTKQVFDMANETKAQLIELSFQQI
jgi:hypothetical protein